MSLTPLFSTKQHFSGNKESGCDAIIVAGKRENNTDIDKFCWLSYTAETRVGGGAMAASARKTLPIRVFRSSSPLCGQYRATTPTKQNKGIYRYDGLYLITHVEFRDKNQIEWTHEEVLSALSESLPGRVYRFALTRIIESKDENSRYLENCIAQGTMSSPDVVEQVNDQGTMPVDPVERDNPEIMSVDAAEQLNQGAIALFSVSVGAVGQVK
jgi:hypothetical protein